MLLGGDPMETNRFGIEDLESNVLLPPRKRLLAGFMKQNSESTLESAHWISSSSPLFGFDARINDLRNSCKNGCSMSLEEIAEAAGLAAATAARTAYAVRAAAEEKSALAAKAMAAARSALALVASFRKRNRGKNKFKKLVSVQLRCKKNRLVVSSKTDEELARSLHRIMNSSPRISKPSPVSDDKKHKWKKIKVPHTPESDRIVYDVPVKERRFPSAHGMGYVLGEVDYKASYEVSHMVKLNYKTSKSGASHLKEEYSEGAESSLTKEKHNEASVESYGNGRKRARIKLKKLTSSFCDLEDEESPGCSVQSRGIPVVPTY